MTNDFEHTTTNFTIWPGALSGAGYATGAIGKWDNGAVVLESNPTYRGFDRFFGYYTADQGHYWYHYSGGIGGEAAEGESSCIEAMRSPQLSTLSRL